MGKNLRVIVKLNTAMYFLMDTKIQKKLEKLLKFGTKEMLGYEMVC